jgi:hypothetical protein
MVMNKHPIRSLNSDVLDPPRVYSACMEKVNNSCILCMGSLLLHVYLTIPASLTKTWQPPGDNAMVGSESTTTVCNTDYLEAVDRMLCKFTSNIQIYWVSGYLDRLP